MTNEQLAELADLKKRIEKLEREHGWDDGPPPPPEPPPPPPPQSEQ